MKLLATVCLLTLPLANALAADQTMLKDADFQTIGVLYMTSPTMLQTAVEIVAEHRQLPTKENLKNALATEEFGQRLKKRLAAR